MAHDFSKTDKTPFEIAQRRGCIVNTDLAPTLTNVQVLSDAFAGPFRPRQFFFESDGRAEHHGSRVADDLVAIITKNSCMPRFQVRMMPAGSSMKIAYRRTPSTS